MNHQFESLERRVRSGSVAGRKSAKVALARACMEVLEHRTLLATISGSVFHDPNFDWVRQSAETGLQGWTVYLDANNNGVLDNGEQSIQTNANGGYKFQDLPAGEYWVRVQQQEGWAPVSPASGVRHLTLLDMGLLDGQLFGESTATCTISGSVFNDANLDRLRQSGEQGLQGWTVYLDANNSNTLDNGERSVQTNANGGYKFENLPAGDYWVRVQQQNGWSLVTPVSGGCHFALQEGESRTGRLFGESPFSGVISGSVFLDANLDRLRQSTEQGLAGWTVYLDRYNAGTLTFGAPSVVTNSNGGYKFENVAPGEYWVRVVQPARYWSTTPVTGAYHVTLGIGEAKTGRLFGQTQVGPQGSGAITGQVTIGHSGSNDTPMPNVRVFLDADDDGVLDPAESFSITDAQGNYSFRNLSPYTYRVAFEIPAGYIDPWHPAATYMFAVKRLSDPGQLVPSVDFQLVPLASITGAVAGRVFDDTDGDGTLDAGESGIPNVRIYIDANNNGVYNVGESITTTAADGTYTFGSLPMGTYTIDFTPPGPASSSAGTPNNYSVTLTAASPNVTGRDFGASGPYTGGVAGQAFNDLNGNGTKDPGESPVAGILVFIDANNNGTYEVGESATTTQGSGNAGNYVIYGVPVGTQHVAITLPDYYRNYTVTWPTQFSNDVTINPNATTTLNLSIKLNAL